MRRIDVNEYDIIHTIIYIILILLFIFTVFYSYKKYKTSKEDYKQNGFWISIFIFLGIGFLIILFR